MLGIRRKGASAQQATGRSRQSSLGTERRANSAYSYYSGSRPQSRKNTSQQPEATRSRPTNDGVTDVSRRRLNRHWYNAPSYLALFVVLVGILFTLSLSSSPRVVVEQVDGVTLTRNSDEYAVYTTQAWQNAWHTKSKLTLNADDIRDQVNGTYTELSDVRIQVPLLGRRPTIVLVPSRAALKLQAQNGTFFLSSDGKALVDVTIIDQNTSVPTVRDQSDVSVEPGKTVLPSQHVAFLLQLYSQLSEQNISGELSLSSTVVNQVEFKPTGERYLVKFLLDDPETVRQAVGSYLAVKARLTGEGKSPAQYIDVRIPEKVFYK